MSSTKTTTATPEQIQIRERERRERRREQARRRRQIQSSKETAEERRQRLDKHWALQRKRLSKETPEERRKRLDRKLEIKRKKQSNETPEQRHNRLERMKERKRIKDKERQEKETPEERQQRLAKGAKQQRLRREVQRQDPQKVMEEREKKRFYFLTRQINNPKEVREKNRINNYFWYQANKERLNSEQERKRRTENYKLWVQSLTGEKKERYLESVRKAVAKSSRKIYARIKQDPIKWQERQRYLRERQVNATPKELLRRKRSLKVNAEKRKLKRKLEGSNFSVEEIELQLRDLGEKMWKDFYPDGDVPLPKSRRPPKKVKEGDKLSTDIPFAKEQSLATFEQAPNEPFILGAAYQTECSGTLEISCKKENYPDLPQVASTEGGPYITSEHWVPGSNNEDAASPSPLPSPPSSPPSNIQDDEETVDPIQYTTDIRLPCPHCDVTFSADQQLRSHVFSFHSKQCWKCPKCKQVMLSPQELSQHYASTHKIIPPQNSTKEVPSSAGNYLCLKCPPLKWFETRQELFIHVKQQHSSNFWPCVDCHVLKYSGHAIRLHHTVCQAAPGRCGNAD